MDGLDSRGQVVVIGATNRIDSIDPALRRPGRFDREFFFGLPKEDARKQILELNTKAWPNVDSEMVRTLAQMTHGYNGADVKQLCTEAALNAVRRTFPQIYEVDTPFNIPLGRVNIGMQDFLESMSRIIVSCRYSAFHRKIWIARWKTYPSNNIYAFGGAASRFVHLDKSCGSIDPKSNHVEAIPKPGSNF
jgi:ATPase family AAA domain-containing protein 2